MQTRAETNDVHLVVVADQRLSGQAITTVLAPLGFRPAGVDVPHNATGRSQLRRLVKQEHATVAIMLQELLDPEHFEESLRTIRCVPEAHWLMLSASQHEADWGAALAAGAEAVLPSSVGVQELVVTLRAMAKDTLVFSAKQRAHLMQALAQRQLLQGVQAH